MHSTSQQLASRPQQTHGMWWVELLNSIVAVLDSGRAGGGAGSYESIATVTVGTDATSISFSSIPSTYASLQIRMMSRMNAYNANANITSRLTFNGDTSSTYWFHWLEGNGSTASAGVTITVLR